MGTMFSGTITNTAGLTKVGSGRLVLSGANTYSVVPRARGRYAQPCQQPGARDWPPTNTGSVDANGVTIANSIMVNSKTTQCRCPPAPRPKPG